MFKKLSSAKKNFKKEFTLFPKTKLELSFNPFLLAQGLIVFIFVISISFSLGNLLVPKTQISETKIIKDVIVKQASPVVVNGESVKWTILVKRSDINQDQSLVQLPKDAKNVKVKKINSTEVQQILSQQKPDSSEQLTLKDRKKLALSLKQPSSFFVASLFSGISKFFLANVEGALDQVIEAVTQEVTTTEDAKLVDLSEQAPTEPVVEETTIEPEVVEEQQETITEEPKIVEEAITEEPEETTEVIPEPEVTEEEQEPATEEATTEELIETTETEEKIPTITEEAGSLNILETVSPSNQELIETETIQDNEEHVAITYETSAPKIEEEYTDKGKLVTVSAEESQDQPQLTDVLAFTTIPEFYKVGQENKIKIKWKNNGDQEVEFHAYDLDGNGKLDYVEWTVPHLSEQIFEIIFISKAFQLDADKNIIADIYDQVEQKDNIWASISDGQYIRATFEQILTNINDNTIYAKPADSSQPVFIEVYPVYTDESGNQIEGSMVAIFENIDEENTYKVYLTNLQVPTDVFDLKIIGGDLDVDWVVDPSCTSSGTGNWNTTGTWSCGHVPLETDDVVIQSGHTVTMDLSSGAVANSLSITGTLAFGSNAYTLTVGAGGVTYNNGANITGTAASIIATSGNVVVNDGGQTSTTVKLNMTGADTTISSTSGGTITGPIVLGATQIVDVASTKTLVFSGIISDDGSAYGISKIGAGTLTLSGNNTFSGGVTIKAGTVLLSTSANAAGSGTITLGDSSGGANATLIASLATTQFANPITVASGSSGTLRIYGNLWNTGGLSGNVTLNNNLTLGSPSAGSFKTVLSGNISGTGDLVLDHSANSIYHVYLSGSSINNIGKITNSGTGPGGIIISAVVGTNITEITQNSSTSSMKLSGNNTFTCGLNIKAGTVIGETSANAFGGSGTGEIFLGNSSGSANAALSWEGIRDSTIANPITVVSGSSGNALEIKSNKWNTTFSGPITLNNNLTFSLSSDTKITGGITGTGNIIISATNSQGFFSTNSINNIGTITNSGTNTISAVIGSNVTSVIQNSATSQLTLSNASNTFFGDVTISAGILNVTQNNTFDTLTIAGDATFNPTNGKTITLTNLVSTGTEGHLAIIKSASAGNAAILTTASNEIITDYLQVTDSTPVQENTWFAGEHGVLVSNYGNWGTVSNQSPNIPVLVSPENASLTTDTTPTLSANYSDPDAEDIGTTNYGIATSAENCLAETFVSGCGGVCSGTSSETLTNNENTTWTPDSSIGDNGTYYWCAQNNDSQITSSWTSMGSFILDASTPDIVAIDAGSDSGDRTSLTSDVWFKYSLTGTDDQISFSWTDPSSVSNDTFYYELNANSGDTITGDESNATNPYVDNIAVSEGTNYFHVRPKTGAGTWGAERTFIIKYDKTVPTTSDNYASDGDWVSENQTITLTPNCDVSGYAWTKYCADTNNSCDPSTGTAYTDPVAIETENTSYFRYASQDNASNTQTTVSRTVKIDKTAPSTIADAGDYTFGQTSSTPVTITLSCADGSGSGCLSTVYCVGAIDCTPTTSYTVPFEVSAENTSYVRFYSIDNVGRTETPTNSETVVIDATKPTPTITSVGGDSSAPYSISDTTPEILLTLDEAGDCYASETDESYDDMVSNSRVNCSGDGTTSQSCTMSDLGADGEKNIYIACQDTAGNKDTNATNEALTYTLDTAPPTVSSVLPASMSTIATSTPTITFTTDENADCRASTLDDSYDDMSDDIDCTGDGTTSQSCTMSDLGADGPKLIYISCKDSNENKDTVDSNYNLVYTLDSTPPTLSSFSPVSGSTITTTTPTITFTTSENADCYASTTDEAYDDMADNTNCTGDGTTSQSCTMSDLGSDGEKNIYIACQDTAGNKDTISTNTELSYTLDVPTPTPTPTTSTGGGGNSFILPTSIPNQIIEIPAKAIEQIIKITDQVINLVIPKEAEKKPEVIIIPEETPEAFKNLDIMDILPTGELGILSINSDINFFSKKIPQFETVLQDLGVDNLNNTEILGKVSLTLPSLTSLVLQDTDLGVTNFQSIPAIPLAELSNYAKQQIPTDIVFTRSEGGLIDYNTNLSFNDEGVAQQKISTIIGKTIELIVKPEQPAKKVLGYVILKNKETSKVENFFSFFKKYLSASLTGNSTSVTEESIDGLLLQKFDYDLVDQGIFKATITAPAVKGEYNITTVIEYENEDLLPKQTNLIAVVDPEGYVYTNIAGMEARTKDVVVSIYWLNPETSKYELWPADKYLQENPQTTGSAGEYSFLVPEGIYYLFAKAKGYQDYQSETFSVKQGTGIHKNIELQRQFTWKDLIDWKVGLGLLLIIAIIYIIYQNIIMKKLVIKKMKQ